MKLPQLSLRDLFWLVALVAMSCGWWATGTGLSERLNVTEAELETTKADLKAERKENGRLRDRVIQLSIQASKSGTLHSYRKQP